MHKNFLTIGALLGAFSVALGAFAAHQLKQVLAADELQIFETAVRYQFYHVFALLATGMLYQQWPVKWMRWSGQLFIAGIPLFSGSLYLLCFIKHQQLNALWVGAITPFGGLCFIAGWLCMAAAMLRSSKL